MDYFSWIESLGSTSAALTAVTAFLLSAYGLGSLVVDAATRTRFRHAALAPALRLAVGINLWGLGFLLLALCLPLRPWLVWGILLPAALYGAWRLVSGLRPPWGKITLLLPFILFIGPILLFMAGAALCLPAGMGLDELSYQISVPWRWLADGFPYVYRDLPYSGFPLLPNFIFEGLLSVGGLKTPRLLVFATHITVMLLMYLLVSFRQKRFAGTVMTLALLLSPVYIFFIGEVYVESFILMNLLAGFAAAKYSRPERAGWLIAGILAGGAAAVKLTGLTVAGIIWLLPWVLRRHPKAVCIKPLLLAALAAAIFAMPFYLRPWIATGNPFHPYFAAYFTDDTATRIMSEAHHSMGAPDAGDALSLPEVFWQLVQGSRVFDGHLGWQFPLLLLLWLAAGCRLTARHKFYRLRDFALMALPALLFIFWYSTARQTRFLLPLFVLLPLLAGLYGQWFFTGRRKYPLLLLLLAGTLFSVPYAWRKHFINQWKAATGKVDTASYLSSTSRDYLIQAYEAIHRLQTPQTSTMVFFERRFLYLPGKYTIATPGFQERYFFLPQDSLIDKEDILWRLRQMLDETGTRFILVEKVLKYNENSQEWHNLTSALFHSFDRLVASGEYLVAIDTPTHRLLMRRPDNSSGRRQNR